MIFYPLQPATLYGYDNMSENEICYSNSLLPWQCSQWHRVTDNSIGWSRQINVTARPIHFISSEVSNHIHSCKG
jgi:hypothetical protein